MSVWVNAVEISEEVIRREAQYHPAGSFELACEEATQALVVRALLNEEARRQGIEVGDGSGEEAISELMDRFVEVPEVSLSSCEQLYEQKPDGFRGPDLFAPSHVLFAAKASDSEARADAKAQAVAVLQELRERPDRFERVARSRSGCPSGANGGSLGQVTRGETMPAFEAALEQLSPGELCEKPVETDHGFHVIRLDDRAPGDRLPFSAVQDRIMIYLRDKGWRRAVHEYVGCLAERAAIRGFDFQDSTPTRVGND